MNPEPCLPINESWRDSALCAQVDPDLFFAENEEGAPGKVAKASGMTKAAKRVCARCPVQHLCLDYALVNRITWGVWGGATEDDRRGMRQQISGTGPVHSDVCRGPGHHVRTKANTRVKGTRITCTDCERAKYLARGSTA
jgi:WhiB family transcriptional regulator, redox-sensing transcriptional regulator